MNDINDKKCTRFLFIVVSNTFTGGRCLWMIQNANFVIGDRETEKKGKKEKNTNSEENNVAMKNTRFPFVFTSNIAAVLRLSVVVRRSRMQFHHRCRENFVTGGGRST